MEKSQARSTLGLLVFLMTELMFFAGLLSAYWVLRSQVPIWPPLGQPRYPVEVTAINTLVLLFSAYLIWKSEKLLSQNKQKYFYYLLAAIGAGGIFLLVQGYEWWQLLRYGMGLYDNVYGGIFYFVVGSHALHVIFGLLVLSVLLSKSAQGAYSAEAYGGFSLGKIYWLFVVFLWPVIYVLLYLL
ncbi:MAG: heme-copper oxidase subunit III [Deltaproteobacteria bacterium]|nr:heme-copper oxidase subunit III [Deltaproteobacteria bacterium]